MRRRILEYPTWVLLAALVAVSSALRAWAGLIVPTPWIVPDEVIYGDIGSSLWQHGHLALLGRPTSFFSFVYPALAGLPLSLGDRQLGYDVLKPLQAIVISSAAVPVYLWGRELVSRGWALVAAVLVLAPPALAYSGLIMTEVAFYPAFVVAAWAIARAVAQPSRRRQALALAAVAFVFFVRLQALVLLPAYATAVIVDAALARRPRRVLLHLPAAAGMVVLALLWSGWQLRHGGPVGRVLGGYEAAGETSYNVWAAAHFVVYHVGDIVLISGVVPFCALLLLASRMAVRPEEDDGVRAFVASALALSVWMVVEVGIFASRHVGHLAERNLFPLLPLFALALVLWLERGAARPLVAGAAAAAVAVLVLVSVPFDKFTTLAATPSAFTQIPLLAVGAHTNLDFAIPLAALVVIAGCAAAPPRVLAVGVPVLLLALGTVASVSASRFVAAQSGEVERSNLERGKRWIEPRVHSRVTYLYSGYLSWVNVWETSFWNPSVGRVYDLFTSQVPGGIPQTTVNPFEDGRLVFTDGTAASADYALAAAPIALAGEQLDVNGGLVLWKIEPPLRLLRWMVGVDVSGNVPSGRAEMRVYGCTGGRLTGTFVTSKPRNFQIFRNAASFQVFTVQPGTAHPFDVSVTVPEPAGQRLCTITLQADGPFSIRGLNFF
jgi:hypothetical protein